MTNKTTNKNRIVELSQDRPTKRDQKHIAENRLFDAWQHNSHSHKSELCDIPSITTQMHTLIAESLKLCDIVGVQEMVKPVGLIYELTHSQQSQSPNNRMVLEITSNAVEVKSKTMSAQYIIEMLKEAADLHYTDLHPEIMQAVALECCREFHNEFMDLIYVTSTDVDFRIDMEESPSVIVDKILEACNVVAQNSHRGKANKVILPYELCMYILPYMIDMNMFEYSQEKNMMGDLLHLGNIFNDIEIYSSIRNTVALFGYKGKSETDTGIMFCPYQLNLFVTTRPDTNEHRVRMRARYATHTVKNASDYYVSIQVR